MSIWWERLEGRTDSFAIKVALIDDPDHGQAATSEDSLSWGSLELWVDGQNLCAHLEDGDRVEGSHWYLLPFLEWLVEHWDAVFHEERLHVPGATNGWATFRDTSTPPAALDEDAADLWLTDWYESHSRHALQASRSGGLLPDIVLRRWQHQIEVSWGGGRLAGAPAGYVPLAASGCSRLPLQPVAEALHSVAVAATACLIQKLPESARLRDLMSRYESLRRDRRTIRLAWLSALARNADDMVARWLQVATRFATGSEDVAERLLGESADGELVVTGHCSAALMFGSVAPDLSDGDLVALAGHLVAAHSTGGSVNELEGWVRPVALGDLAGSPWEQGYSLAADLLDRLGLPGGDRSIDVDRVLEDLAVRIEDVALADETVRAVAIAGPDHTPTVLLNTSHATSRYRGGRRFTLAHELCHLLHDRAYGQPLAMATGPWAPAELEQRANAFAAMFLMPPDLVRAELPDWPQRTIAGRDIVRLADKLDASVTAAMRHIHNLGFIDSARMEALEHELSPRPGAGHRD